MADIYELLGSKNPFNRCFDPTEWFDEHTVPVAALHPHATCPKCKEASEDELVNWFVKEGWRQSKQELVAKLRKEFTITKKGTP